MFVTFQEGGGSFHYKQECIIVYGLEAEQFLR